jgi:predicted small secreted protein
MLYCLSGRTASAAAMSSFWEIEMKNVICKGLFLVAASFLTLQSFGCNTVEGAGKDTENLGESVQKAADKNK